MRDLRGVVIRANHLKRNTTNSIPKYYRGILVSQVSVISKCFRAVIWMEWLKLHKYFWRTYFSIFVLLKQVFCNSTLAVFFTNKYYDGILKGCWIWRWSDHSIDRLWKNFKFFHYLFPVWYHCPIKRYRVCTLMGTYKQNSGDHLC